MNGDAILGLLLAGDADPDLDPDLGRRIDVMAGPESGLFGGAPKAALARRPLATAAPLPGRDNVVGGDRFSMALISLSN